LTGKKLWDLPKGSCDERLAQTGEHVAPVKTTIPARGVMEIPVTKWWCAFCGQILKSGRKKKRGMT
jgi:hypothetical protein